MIVAGLTITDNTQAFSEDLRDEICRRLQVSADHLVQVARELVSTPGPPRSSAHNPPHIDTSALYLSIDNEPIDRENLSVLVGSGIGYALYLELGTSKMLPRPWLRPALARATPFIVHTFLAPLPNSTSRNWTNTRGLIRYRLGFGF